MYSEWNKTRPLFLPGQREVVSVVLQGFAVLLEVEVGVPQLAVDGTERLQVFCAHLDGSLKERCPSFKVPGFAQSLPFQRQLQARGLHPGEDKTNTSESLQPSEGKSQNGWSQASVWEASAISEEYGLTVSWTMCYLPGKLQGDSGYLM